MMARPIKCPVRLSPDSNQRLHADGAPAAWLKVAPGSDTNARITRPWCRGCVLDLTTPVSVVAASVMEFFEDQKMLAMDAAVIIESIEARPRQGGPLDRFESRIGSYGPPR